MAGISANLAGRVFPGGADYQVQRIDRAAADVDRLERLTDRLAIEERDAAFAYRLDWISRNPAGVAPGAPRLGSG